MSDIAKRPNLLFTLLILIGLILGGAYVSSVPFAMVKVAGATLLFFLYGFCAARFVGSLQIHSAGVRKMIGLVLGLMTVYLTWAVRLPVFSDWEVAFTFDPSLLLNGIQERASSMQLSSGMGHGTTTEGPSWLLLGTYIFEALAFVGAMYLAAWLSAPDKAEDAEGEAVTAAPAEA